MNTIRVAVTDDHPMVASGIAQLLRADPRFIIQALYNNGTELRNGLLRELPDVLLLDMHFPDTTGKELMKDIAINHPSLKVLVLSSVDNVYDIKEMMQQGCYGYVLKSARLDILVQAIETVFNGEQFLQPEIKELLLQNALGARTKVTTYKLTQREQTILELLSRGKTNNEMAAELFLSHRTIENHRLSLYQKLGVHNTGELVRVALEQGLIK